MEVGQADRIKIQLDRHSKPREVKVLTANIKSETVEVQYPGTSPGRLIGDLREDVDLDDVVEVVS